jgi:type VI secretion system secreted protein Hcp
MRRLAWLLFPLVFVLSSSPNAGRGQVTAQPVAGPGAVENFESLPLVGWELLGGAAVTGRGQGRALVFSGPGHGFWQRGPVQDFELGFRYQHGEGLFEVVFRASGEPADGRSYNLRLGDREAALIRIGRRAEQKLASASVPLRRGAWHTVSVAAAGGEFRVSVNGAAVLSATDGQQLPPGGLGFGCITGAGFVVDDVALTLYGPPEPGQGPGITPINLPGQVVPAGTAGTPGGRGPAGPTGPPVPLSQPPPGSPPSQGLPLPDAAPGAQQAGAQTQQTGPTPAGGYCYLRIAGVQGDSTNAAFPGWMEAVNFRYGVKQSGVEMAGSSRRKGKPQFDLVSVLKVTDRATPILNYELCTGRIFANVELASRSSFGGPEIRLYLTQVMIAAITGEAPGPGGRAIEEVKLSFETIQWQVSPEKPDGSLGATVKTKWDLVTEE